MKKQFYFCDICEKQCDESNLSKLTIFSLKCKRGILKLGVDSHHIGYEEVCINCASVIIENAEETISILKGN